MSTAISGTSGVDAQTGVSYDVSGYFSDPDTSDKLTYTANGLPPGLSIDPNTGVITGTIDHSASQGGNNGVYTVTVTATDPSGATTSQSFDWDVTNPAPTALDDAGQTDEDTTLSVDAANGVLSNDNDPDGDTLTVTEVNGSAAGVGSVVTGSGGGTFTLNADGSYTFNPGADFQNLAAGEKTSSSITYLVSDGEGGTSTATLTVEITGTNDAPVAIALDNRDNMDGDTVSYDLSGYFSDIDNGDALTYSVDHVPGGLTFDTATGTFSGTLANWASDHTNTGVKGEYLITVTATDKSGASVSQTFVWTIGNPEPIALDDAGRTQEDTVLVVDHRTEGVLGNDRDPDGDALSVSQVNGKEAGVGQPVAGSNGGTFTLNADGTYTFNPGADFQRLGDGQTATTSITYTVTDAQGATDKATLVITVTGSNDAPILTPDVILGDLSNNDSDVITPVDIAKQFQDVDQGDTLTYTATGLPPGLALDPVTGLISGKIDSSASQGGNNGVYTIVVTATDASGAKISQTFEWDIKNPAPKAVDDQNTTDEETSLTVDASNGVLANDSDPDGDTIKVSQVNDDDASVGQPVAGSHGGTFTLNADGSYSFNPGSDFQYLNDQQTATTSITYTVVDADGATTTATLTVTVTGSNDAPILTPDVILGDLSNNDSDVITPVDIAKQFQDVDQGDTLTYTATGLPPGLALDPVTGLISGKIDSSASQGGNNGVYTIVVTATDASGAKISQTFEWDIKNPAPKAVDDQNTTDEETSLTVDASNGVLANDSDPDGDTIKVSQVNDDDASVGQPVAGSHGGTFTLNADGSYSFNPGSDFQYLNDQQTATTSITYTVVDADGATTTATLTVTVTGQTDAPPVITPEDTDGTVTGAHNSVIEASGDIVTGSVTVSAEAGIRGVTVGGQDVTGANNTPVVITTDKGILTITGYDAATGKITYSYQETGGADDHSGGDNAVRDSFPVVVTDLAGVSNSNDLVIQIIDTEPKAEDDVASVTEDTTAPITGNVLANDTLGADASTTVINTADAKYGTLIDNGDGTWSYQLNNGLEAVQALNDGDTLTETIRYTITDADGDIAEAVITITINGQTDGPPVITPEDSDGTVTGAHNSVIEGTGDIVTGSVTVSAEAGIRGVTVGGQDVTGANTTPVVITTDKGILTITGYDAATGKITYSYQETGGADDHSDGDNAVRDLFQVAVTDVAGKTTTGDLVIQIIDTEPTAEDDVASVTEDTTAPITGNVLANDTLGADASTTVINTADAKYGTLIDNGDGTWSYQLNNGLEAVQALNDGDTLTETIRYTITDADGDIAEAVITITINGQTDGPPVITPEDSDGTVTGAHNSVIEGTGDIVTGSVTVSAEAGIRGVTVGGQDVTGANTTPVVITTDKGILTITGYDAATGKITYSYQETGGADDHSDGDNAVRDLFQVAVTDVAGKTTTGDLVIQIIDTEPKAEDDTASVTEDATAPITGNVLANDTLGADASTTVINTADAKYGTLIDNGDGTWSYQLNNGLEAVQALNDGDTLTETIRYTITDADGDIAEAVITITINGQTDGPPVITPEDSDGTVTGAHNSVIEASGDIVTGSVTVSAEAGIRGVTVGGQDVTGANNTPVVITTDKGILTITGYDAATGKITYSYQETGGADDHSDGDNAVRDLFQVAVTDVAGKTTTGDLVIQIIDTEPKAEDDTASVTEDATAPITGNVLANDTLGADASTTVINTADAKYGTLIDNGDGTWSYQLNNGLEAVQALNDGDTLTETIRYTITDADGDIAEAVITITINGQTDGPPVITPEDSDGTVTGAHNSVIEASGDIVTGSVTVSAEAGIRGVTVGGQDVTGANNTPVVITTDKGILTITGYDAATGKITYSYQETGGADDHSDGDNAVRDLFQVAVTDVAGKTTTGDLVIQIIDTEPKAEDDTASVTEDATAPITGNVLANDTLGADASTTVINTADAKYGTLIDNGDGTWSYQLNNGLEAVQALNDGDTLTETIRYTITDADGDIAEAVITITINGQTDGPPVITPEDTDGTVTGAHNSVIEGTGDIVTGSVTVSAEAGIRGVTVGGQDVTGANTTPVVITTDKGILTITGYDAATGKITYSYEETGGADDHRAGNDSVRDEFQIVVTDVANVSRDNNLVIQIIDTEPKAEDDVASVTEDATAPITGNVLANDTLGADASTTVINTADAKYGTLIDNGDGTWSYQLNNGLEAVQALNDGDTLTETIRYTITDADGDIAEAVITITINGQTDGPPVITPEDSDGTVTGAHNSVIEGTGDIVTGSVTVSAEAGIRGVTVGGQDVTGANNTPVVITTDKGILTITGYDAATGKITYSYQETGGADDHSDGDNAVRDLFQVAVTDVAGKTTTGDLVIQIIDTEPTAEDDVASVTEDTTAPITGNVLANDTLGADASTTVINTADAKYGTLIDNGDGTWSYQLNNGLEAVQALNDGDTLTETIRYTITDADGDIAEAVITITINGQTDGPPVITPEDSDGTVTGAHNSVVEGTGDIVTGSVTVSAEAGIRGVTVGGQDVTGANNTPVVITTDKGVLTITGYDAATGKITYSYQETGGADDHSDGDNAVRDLFQVAVTDVAGKTTTGDLVVQIIDTEPKAEDDVASVTEDATAPITGNVLANDTLGADASTTVINTADAKYGTLIDNGDGTWSYQLNNGLEAVQALNDGDTLTETIRYTITDADGDIAEAVITITINGQTDGPPVITPEDSDGTVTGAHNSVIEGTGDIVTGSVTVSAEAGIRGVTVGGQDVTGANNTPVVITTDKGILTITGYDAATGKITYSYQETGGADDHSAGDDKVRDEFQVAVTDVAGKTTTGDLVIQIIDTEPTANDDDGGSVTEDATVNTLGGNVVDNDTKGADAIKDVTWNVSDAQRAEIEQYGTLTLNNDGTWRFTLDNSKPAVQALGANTKLDFTLDYTITDADGDESSATLSLSINGANDAPTITSAILSISEEGLPLGLEDDKGVADTTDAATYSGKLIIADVDSGDAHTVTLVKPADTALYSQGRPVVWSLSGDGHTLVGTDYLGKPVITMTVTNTGDYTVTLSGQVDHPTNSVEDVLQLGVGVVVSDGHTTSGGSITVNIEDDSPEFGTITNTTMDNTSSTVQGTLEFNTGADSVGATLVVSSIGKLPEGWTTSTLGQSSVDIFSPDGSKIFTVTVNPAGGYTVTQHEARPGTTESIDLASSITNNPQTSYDLGYATLTAGGGKTFNANSFGSGNSFGIGNTSFDAGESFRMDFKQALSDFSLNVAEVKGSGTVQVTVWSGNESRTFSLNVNGSTGSLHITKDMLESGTPSLSHFDAIQFTAGGGVKMSFLTTGSYTENIPAGPMDFTVGVTGTDGDGDKVTGEFTVTSNATENSAPEIHDAHVSVSEEGLAGGIKDSNGTVDQSNETSYSGVLQISDANGNQGLSVSLQAPADGVLVSGGKPVTWTLADGNQTLTGTVDGKTVITVTVDNQGNYSVKLDAPVDHPNKGVEDVQSFGIGVKVTDALGASSTATITVNVEDDMPANNPNPTSSVGVPVSEIGVGGLQSGFSNWKLENNGSLNSQTNNDSDPGIDAITWASRPTGARSTPAMPSWTTRDCAATPPTCWTPPSRSARSRTTTSR